MAEGAQGRGRVTQCDVTVVNARGGSRQTRTLQAGSVLRLGRHAANDFVLDCEGVSAFHAELFLRTTPSAGPEGFVCVRDNSKNGTGVRPGPEVENDPHRSEGLEPPWESRKRGGFCSLDHGWQLLAPLRAAKAPGVKVPQSAALVTLYLGNVITSEDQQELDGEEWEPGADSLEDFEAAELLS